MRKICDLIQQLAGRPPGEEPTWELAFAVALLTRLVDAAGRTHLIEHLSRRLEENWRAVLKPEGPQLVGPLPCVCGVRDQLHD